MPNKTKCSDSRKAYYKTSFDVTKRNKERKLAKHLKRHPNDKQSLKKQGVPVDYTPKNKVKKS